MVEPTINFMRGQYAVIDWTRKNQAQSTPGCMTEFFRPAQVAILWNGFVFGASLTLFPSVRDSTPGSPARNSIEANEGNEESTLLVRVRGIGQRNK